MWYLAAKYFFIHCWKCKGWFKLKPRSDILNIVCPHFPQAGEWRQLRVRGGEGFFWLNRCDQLCVSRLYGCAWKIYYDNCEYRLRPRFPFLLCVQKYCSIICGLPTYKRCITHQRNSAHWTKDFQILRNSLLSFWRLGPGIYLWGLCVLAQI